MSGRRECDVSNFIDDGSTNWGQESWNFGPAVLITEIDTSDIEGDFWLPQLLFDNGGFVDELLIKKICVLDGFRLEDWLGMRGNGAVREYVLGEIVVRDLSLI